jgi:hypothetical protein
MIKLPAPIQNALIWVAAAFAVVAALLGWGQSKKRQGANEAKAEGQIEDYENAQDINRRVSDGRADRVRELDDAGYRD